MKCLTAIALALASLAATSAFASTSQASATLGPLGLQLFDLVPGGPSPWIAFNAGASGGSGDSYVDGSAYASAISGPYPSYYVEGSSAFDPTLAGTIGTAISEARSSVSGTGVAAGTKLSATGWAVGPVVADRGDYAVFYAKAAAPTSALGATFTLSPGTMVLFSATASLSVMTDSLGSDYFSYVNAVAWMAASGPSPGGGGAGQTPIDYRLIGAGVTPSYAESLTVPLSVAFINLTDSEMTGTFDQYVSVDGAAYAVPEPGTYALMLAGLATVGSLVRRRARH